LMVLGSWAHFDRSFDWQAPLFSRDSTLDIQIPLWPAKLVVPVAFSVFAMRSLLHLWAYAKAWIDDSNQPVAVPLPIDVVTQAAQEAESVSDGPNA